MAFICGMGMEMELTEKRRKNDFCRNSCNVYIMLYAVYGAYNSASADDGGI